ncbi:rhodanese-like domain-containing protein [Desulfonatronospira sp.]|uniref:rhodanese-like domain-containing protein n=1 Tax=Desulfonatronospira sp. TaxID=1962951 RepID=UPI0025C2B748|nr:rhodanese-like domain-containing protein [Desulfonatronospira sp.]
MERVLVLGYGYPAYKAAQLIRELKPEADLLWITEYSEDKYPLEMVELLLSLGNSPAHWSRTRAKVKVDFEKNIRMPGISPVKVKKIRFDLNAREVSFLSNTGNMSYFFDQAFVFPEPVFSSPSWAPPEGLLWPESSSVEHLVNNWSNLETIKIVGNDISAVQALACGEKSFELVRSRDFFSRQVQFFVDEYLKSRGGSIVKSSDPENFSPGTAFQNDKNAVIYCSSPVLDLDKLKNMGIDSPAEYIEGSGMYVKNNVCVAAPYAARNYAQTPPSLDYSFQAALFVVKSLLGEENPRPPQKNTRSWNMAGMHAGSAGLNPQQALEKGFNPEWAIISHPDSPLEDGKHVLHLIVDKDSRRILGAECAGREADAWVDMAGHLVLENAVLEDLLEQEMISSGFGLHPLKKCARILKNKLGSRIMGVTPTELEESYNQGAEFFLLDLRSPEEYQRIRISGAENIPLPELKKKAVQIPRFVPLVLYSRCSGRAYQGARLLQSMGAKQLYVLDGGMELWPLTNQTEQENEAGPIISTSGCSISCC